MKVDLKSAIAGMMVGAVGVSLALAEQISVPHEFTAGTTARASEVNENFSVLQEESNAQDIRISELSDAVEGLGGAEQLYCIRDFRSTATVGDGHGSEVDDGFPVPRITHLPDTTIVALTPTGAICFAPSDPNAFIVTDLATLTDEGWRLLNLYPSHVPRYSTKRVPPEELEDLYVFGR